MTASLWIAAASVLALAVFVAVVCLTVPGRDRTPGPRRALHAACRLPGAINVTELRGQLLTWHAPSPPAAALLRATPAAGETPGPAIHPLSDGTPAPQDAIAPAGPGGPTIKVPPAEHAIAKKAALIPHTGPWEGHADIRAFQRPPAPVAGTCRNPDCAQPVLTCYGIELGVDGGCWYDHCRGWVHTATGDHACAAGDGHCDAEAEAA